MESFQFMEFPSGQISYDIEDPDQSGESHPEAKSTLDAESVELPLPPGTTGDEFFVSLGYKADSLQTLSLSQTVSNEGKSKSDLSELNNFTYGPQLPSNYKKILENQNPNKNDSESTTNSGDKISDYFHDNRYSPSKVDSDEENQDVASKPKVLGKEQAKKRLMAFSIAKQSANSAKKQNKTTPAKKEKPPNPNKGTNFQDQFRATISAIEEEKKKIYQNMPDYMLQEMNELVKGHVVSSPNLKSSDKKDRDNKKKDKSVRYDSASKKANERKRGSRRSRSRSSSRRRRRSRRSRSRSRSRSNGGYNKRKRRSWSRSRRSRSPGKKSMDKQVKSELTKPGKNEKDIVPKKEVFEDWKSFKNSAVETGSDSVFLKNELHKSESQEPEPAIMPQGCQSHFKPIFNYLNKGYHKMTPLRAKRVDPNNGKLALFPEKTIKFTRTKPVIIWTENPSLATDYFMPMEVLLENCQSGFEPILRFIIEGKSSELSNDNLILSSTKSRQWYPREKYLRHFSPKEVKKTETVVQNSPAEDQLKETVTQPSERKISLVNEDYLSDEMEQDEITVGDIKVQLDMEMNTVKVRSKWDSDFEDGNNEKESSLQESQNKEVHGIAKKINSEEKLEEFLIEPLRGSSKEKVQLVTKSPGGKNTDSHPGYLASEYEEFLKMVSFDSKDTQDSQTENITQYDITKCESVRKTEKAIRENDKSLKPSIDWDNESEQEEEFKILPEKHQIGGKLIKSEKLKKKKGKIEKLKLKKKKVKKPSKVKMDKYPHSDDSSTSGSESDSDSDSDSDSNSESDSPREMKKKKNDSKRKKNLKEKKKSKKYLSDKSETDSDGGKLKKKKGKKKRGSSDSEESQRKMLKQIDCKKQSIMKKVEEIDTVMEKTDKKKGRENEFRKEYSENDKGLKSGKKKNKTKSTKKIKQKKIKSSDTDSDSVSSRESTEKKAKKKISKKRISSETSDSDEDTKPSKTKSSKLKKAKKEKKKKGKKYSSSSESDEVISTKKWKKKKKDVNLSKQLTSSVPVVETEVKMEGRLSERSSKTLNKKGKKNKKEEDEWETSSSSAELEDESESSWDEEVKAVVKGPEIGILKEKQDDVVLPKKEETEKTLVSEGNLLSGSETLKNSMSNFSFNESSFCGFEQELSRDFFLTERSFSSSANIGTCESTGLAPIEARPFQCIGKREEKKTVTSELYSPGCSDSELSDTVAKSEKSNTDSPTKDVYDPLNCESEGSGSGDNEVQISTIPLPTAGDISLPHDQKSQKIAMSPLLNGNNELDKVLLSNTPPLKFIANEFSLTPNAPLNENSPKKQIMNFKNQQTLKTKAASLFQGDSDEENKEPEKSKEEKPQKTDKETDEKKKSEKDTGDKSKERDRKRSRSRERKGKKSSCKTPEASKREIRSDSFEIEPLKSVADELVESVQPIPVLLGVSSNRVWSGSLPGYEFPQVSDNLVNEAESFDIYPSEETKYPSENYTHDLSVEKMTEKLGKRRKSRSKSLSPRKKRKSKSPVRRRSPKRWSISPKHRDKSSRSPRRRSPKRKSPSRRRSGSPSRRRKSRRLSSPRRSRSKSPPKRRSPKRWDSSPRRKDSPPRGYSPRRDSHYPNYPDHPYWVPSTGVAEKDDMEVSPPDECSPQYNSSMAFPPRMAGPSVAEAEINNSFYEGEYANEYGVNSYREEIGMNNLITIKNHSLEKLDSPKRPSLDQRIELELGSPISSSSSQFPNTSQPPQPFEGIEPNHYSAYNCDNSGANENFYPNQGMPDFNGQYFNEVQPSNYGAYPYPHTHPQPQSQPPSGQNAVMQVGNIVEVVPALQHSLRPPPPPKTPQIMQVGNVLQVVPTQKVSAPAPVPPPVLDHESLPSSPVVKTQKATAVVAPSSVVPPPNLEAMMNPLIKAILLEREKRRKAKEKRRLEREARRKARQLRREAKLMSVSEKLKKSVQNEGLVLGQEVEDDELLDAMDIPSPPVPVQIITVSSPNAASPAAKGILITAGFVSKSPSKKKEVKFADGVYPGEGTSSSGEEDVPLSPPKPKLPKEKPFKKKKIKIKKKVKVHIIKQILHEEEDDEDDDNLSPPPPPPGDPPPVFFARFPFAGNAQFPVYQTQTTPVTSVQYPAQAV